MAWLCTNGILAIADHMNFSDMDLDFPMNGEGFNLGRDFDPVGGVPASEGDPVQDYIDVDMTPISASKKRKVGIHFRDTKLMLIPSRVRQYLASAKVTALVFRH